MARVGASGLAADRELSGLVAWMLRQWPASTAASSTAAWCVHFAYSTKSVGSSGLPSRHCGPVGYVSIGRCKMW